MNEQSIASAKASVLIYDATLKKWIPSGTSSGISKVHIYHHLENNTFRVVGRKIQNHEVVINCLILKGLKYFQATATFHQWQDNRQIHGLNFLNPKEAETFALAMERVLDILGHSSVYTSKYRSPPHLQPVYQTIGHSGISLDDYAEYKGWMNNENDGRKSSTEYGHYIINHANSSSHPTTPGSSSSSNNYSHHRTSSAPSMPKQHLSVISHQSSPQTNVPPPPPPPPPLPPTNLNISGLATLPRLSSHLNIMQDGSEISLAAALVSAKLKKTPEKSMENISNENKHSPAIKGMASIMDEMTKTLARRRAQTDNTEQDGDNEDKNWQKTNSSNDFSLATSSGDESPHLMHRSESDNDNKNHIIVDTYEVEKIKKEILLDIKKEMNKMKQEIIAAIRAEIIRR